MSSERKELIDEQQRGQVHNQNLSVAGSQKGPMFGNDGKLKSQYLESLTNTTLSQGTIRVLENLLSQDFVLGNITDPELNEIKWLTRLTSQKVFAMHPGKKCGVTGRHRAFYLDDRDNHLEALTEEEQVIIENFIRGVFLRASRARDGWQQEQMSKTISVSEIKDDDEGDEDSLVRGLFS